jgi:hypothetical protein
MSHNGLWYLQYFEQISSESQEPGTARPKSNRPSKEKKKNLVTGPVTTNYICVNAVRLLILISNGQLVAKGVRFKSLKQI